MNRPGEAEGGKWRVGNHYDIHVYEGDRPVATFHDPADARCAVDAAVNRADIREQDNDLLMRADSLLSFIRYRESAGLSQQTVRDLNALLPALRRRTDEIGAKGSANTGPVA